MRRTCFAIWAIVLGLVFSGGTAIYARASQTTTSPAPDLTIPPIPPMAETKEQHKARLEAEGQLIHLSGPATKGSTITIANKRVKLPEDAYVESFVVSVDCATSPCPETPAYVIRRGDSTTWVSARTGNQSATKLAPGSDGAFAFLKEALEQ